MATNGVSIDDGIEGPPTARASRYNTRTRTSQGLSVTDHDSVASSSLMSGKKASRKRKPDVLKEAASAGSRDIMKKNKASTGSRRGTLITEKHILFWGGPLSNWNLEASFSGDRILSLLLPRLDQDKIPRPSDTSLGTRLLRKHEFNCGEQAMMAMKAWLFEKNELLESDHALGEEEIKTLTSAILDLSVDIQGVDKIRDTAKQARDTFLVKILHTALPKTQKALGRKIPNFNEPVWQKSSTHVVTCASIARAEADAELRTLYLEAGTRGFVEGSPVDRIWGIGLKWDNPLADDKTKWRGRNLLGLCHDRAAEFVRTHWTVEQQEGKQPLNV